MKGSVELLKNGLKVADVAKEAAQAAKASQKVAQAGKELAQVAKSYGKVARRSETIADVSKVAKGVSEVVQLTEPELQRIQNAANKIGKLICVVGSRAKGTAKVTSDFDYVIEGINSKQWGKIKNSLPGAPSRIDNLPRHIDLLRGPVDTAKSHVTIYPK